MLRSADLRAVLDEFLSERAADRACTPQTIRAYRLAVGFLARYLAEAGESLELPAIGSCRRSGRPSYADFGSTSSDPPAGMSASSGDGRSPMRREPITIGCRGGKISPCSACSLVDVMEAAENGPRKDRTGGGTNGATGRLAP